VPSCTSHGSAPPLGSFVQSRRRGIDSREDPRLLGRGDGRNALIRRCTLGQAIEQRFVRSGRRRTRESSSTALSCEARGRRSIHFSLSVISLGLGARGILPVYSYATLTRWLLVEMDWLDDHIRRPHVSYHRYRKGNASFVSIRQGGASEKRAFLAPKSGGLLRSVLRLVQPQTPHRGFHCSV